MNRINRGIFQELIEKIKKNFSEHNQCYPVRRFPSHIGEKACWKWIIVTVLRKFVYDCVNWFWIRSNDGVRAAGGTYFGSFVIGSFYLSTADELLFIKDLCAQRRRYCKNQQPSILRKPRIIARYNARLAIIKVYYHYNPKPTLQPTFSRRYIIRFESCLHDTAKLTTDLFQGHMTYLNKESIFQCSCKSLQGTALASQKENSCTCRCKEQEQQEQAMPSYTEECKHRLRTSTIFF